MKTSPRLATLRLVLGGWFVLILQAAFGIFGRIQEFDVPFSLISKLWLLFLALIFISILNLMTLILSWTQLRQRMIEVASRLIQLLPDNRIIVICFLVVLNLGYSFLTLLDWGKIFGNKTFFWLATGIVIVLVLVLVRRLKPLSNWLNLLALSGLIVAGFVRLIHFLPDVSNLPFSLAWSEASRYYYASLFYSEKLYGLEVPPSTLHPTRYLLQALPFFLEFESIWFHRLWQVALWLIGSFGTGVLLSHRVNIPSKNLKWGYLIWVFLFLWQGPVYYHLLVIVMIVLWGFDSQRLWRTVFIVLGASIWAGISRVNWFPVPGMLAAVLYFLEQPLNANNNGEDEQSFFSIPTLRSSIRYLIQPALWIVSGTLIALVSQSVYIIWSGNDPTLFTSSFSSDLLWYRLFPSSIFSFGVLLGVILVSLPICFLFVNRYRSGTVRLKSIALLSIGAILSVLLIGGLIVSVKIGGGSNLHNLDAYISLLLVVGSYIYFERIPIDDRNDSTQVKVPAILNLFLVAVPVIFSLSSSSRLVEYDLQRANESIVLIQQHADNALEDGGEVLFISERQLLTFDYITGVTLVPEYEKVFLMEMVMAGNRTYIDKFQDEIQNQRFDLIISEPIFDRYKDRNENWAEENNVWVESVSVPILCYYESVLTLKEFRTQLLTPKTDVDECNFRP